MQKEELIGNITTIIKIILITYAPAEVMSLIDPNTLTALITAIVCFIFAITDSYYPNAFKWLGNDKPSQQEQILETPLNEEYIFKEDDL